MVQKAKSLNNMALALMRASLVALDSGWHHGGRACNRKSEHGGGDRLVLFNDLKKTNQGPPRIYLFFLEIVTLIPFH